MNLPCVVFPVLQESRRRFESWSLVLHVKEICVKDKTTEENEKKNSEWKEEEGFELMRSTCDSVLIEAFSREVRTMQTLPCLDITHKLEKAKVLENGINLDSQRFDVKVYSDFESRSTLMSIDLSNEEVATDSMTLQLIEEVIKMHYQNFHGSTYPLVRYIKEMIFPIAIFGMLNLEVNERPNCTDVLLIDGDGWIVGGLWGISFSLETSISTINLMESEISGGNESDKMLKSGKAAGNRMISENELNSRAQHNECSSYDINQNPHKTVATCTNLMMCDEQHRLIVISDNIKVIAASLTAERIDNITNFVNMGFDSLKLAEFEYRLREHFKTYCKLPYGCAFKHSTIESLSKYVYSQVNLDSENSPSQNKVETNLFGCSDELTATEKKILNASFRKNDPPLSTAQRSFVFMAKFYENEGPNFIERVRITFNRFNLCKLRQSLNELIGRQRILRTRYTPNSQVVLSLTEAYLYIGFSAINVVDIDEVMINIFTDPPLIVKLESSKEYILKLRIHHIAIDGYAMRVLKSELFAIYLGRKLNPLKIQYAHYALLEEQKKKNWDEPCQKFWKPMMEDSKSEGIPTDIPRSPSMTHTARTIEFPVHEHIAFAIKKIAESCLITEFATILSIYSIFVHKMYNVVETIVGIPYSNRDSESFKSIIGCMIGVLPIRVRIDRHQTLIGHMQSVFDAFCGAVSHQIPFSDLVSIATPERDTSRSPLFQTMLVMDEIDQSKEILGAENDEHFEIINEPASSIEYDQIWYFIRNSEKMSLRIEYKKALFYKETMARLAQRFFSLIDVVQSTISMRQSATVGSTGLECSTDNLEYYRSVQANRCDFPFVSFPQIINRQNSLGVQYNALFSDKTKLGNRSTTQRKAMLSQKLSAEYLSRFGETIRNDDLILVRMERSVDVILICLAIWDCGCAVVALDNDLPTENVMNIVKSLNNPLLFSNLSSGDFHSTDGSFMIIDCECFSNSAKPNKDVSHVDYCDSLKRSTLQDIAYITYTSGSTGRPKGVCAEFSGVSNVIMNYTLSLTISPKSVIYQVVNPAFDIFIADFAKAFCNGCSLVLAKSKIPNIEEMKDVTHAYIMPAYLSVVGIDAFMTLSKLELITFGGETIQPKTLSAAVDDGLSVLQEYGSTEASIFSVIRRMKKLDKPSCIGEPFRNVEAPVYQNERLVSVQEVGICHLTGVGVSRGYIGQNSSSHVCKRYLTKEDSILNSNALMFITRDQVRKETLRTLSFLQRGDDRIKIRGYFVHLYQIEESLAKIPYISSSVVVPDYSNSSASLVAYCILGKMAGIAEENSVVNVIVDELSKKLPSHMIPSNFVFVKSFPLNPNGKVDKNRLVESNKTSECTCTQVNTEEESAIGRKILAIFEEVLNISSLSPTESFFHVGGDSLKALLASQKIESDLGVKITLKDIFRYKTFRLLIDAQSSIVSQVATKLSDSYRVETIPLSYTQQGIWFLTQMTQNKSCYFIKMNIRVNSLLSPKYLQLSYNYIIRQHSILRTIFKFTSEKPSQEILSLTESYFRSAQDDNDAGCLDELYNEMTNERWERPPWMVKTSFNDGTLISFVFHHSLMDGRSITIVNHDLTECYKSAANSRLPFTDNDKSRTNGYAMYSIIQRRQPAIKDANDLKYFIEHLRDVPELLVPLDFPRPKVLVSDGQTVGGWLDASSCSVLAWCREHGCSLFSFLLGCYALLLRNLSGQQKFVIGSVAANRDQNTNNILGPFVNSIPIPVNTNFIGLDEFIESVMDVTAEVVQRQNVPFERIVQEMKLPRDTSKTPIFQYSLVLQTASPTEPPNFNGVNATVEEVPSNASKYDQTLLFQQIGSRISFRFEYNTSLFRLSTILRHITMYQRVVELMMKEKDLKGIQQGLHDAHLEYERDLLQSMKLLKHKITEEKIRGSNELKEVGCSSSEAVASDYKHKLVLNELPDHRNVKINIENQILAVWRRFLKQDDLSTEDNFFAIGGHSLIATHVCRELSRILGYDIPVLTIFEHQTISSMAYHIVQQQHQKNPETEKLRGYTRKANMLQSAVLQIYMNGTEGNSLRFAHILGFTVRIKHLIIERLNNCLNHVLMRHAILRSTYQSKKNQFYVEVYSATECYFALQSAVNGSDILRDLQLNPFEGMSIACALYHNWNDEWTIFEFRMSHAISDGRSVQIIQEELIDAYNSHKLPQVDHFGYFSFSYDYDKKATANSADLAYWRSLLSNADMLHLSADKPVPAILDRKAATYVQKFRKLHGLIQKIARRLKCTPFTVIFGCFTKVLKLREALDRKQVVAFPCDLRSGQDIGYVGLYVIALPFVIEDDLLSGEMHFKNVQQQLQQNIFHSSVTAREIYELIDPKQSFGIMIVLDDYPIKDGADKFEVVQTTMDYTKYEITIFVSPRNDDIEVRIEYMEKIFYRETIQSIADEWARCIHALDCGECSDLKPNNGITTPAEDIPLYGLSLLLLRSARNSWYDQSMTTNAEFLTYSDLIQQICDYSRAVRAEYLTVTGEDLRNDTIIPIVATNSIQTFVVCLAVIFAGGTYLPVDETLPKHKVEAILRESHARTYISESELDFVSSQRIVLNRIDDDSDYRFRPRSGLDDLAYVIFTSGTTGIPKGVAIQQKGVVNLAAQSARNFSLCHTDCVYQFTNFAFDNSVLEVIMAMSTGARLFVQTGVFTEQRMSDNIERYNVTHILLFPSLVATFSDQTMKKLSSLRQWIVGAEKLSQWLLEKMINYDVRVMQNYGPTETTAYALTKRMHRLDHANNLGRPIRNVSVKLSGQADGTLVVRGELIILGCGVMRGYLNRGPLDPNEGFASGDRVRLLPNGDIIYLEREDSQLKVRGYRIEGSEVEATLMKFDNIRQAKVICNKENDALLAFITVNDKTLRISLRHLREWCIDQLPHYMVPSHFYVLPFIPLTRNAKTDKEHLLLIHSDGNVRREGVEYGNDGIQHPSTSTERRLQQLFESILRTSNILVTDDFFRIGGNSITAQRLSDDIRMSYNIEISAGDIFENRTIRELAMFIEEKNRLNERTSTRRNCDKSRSKPKIEEDQISSLSKQLNYDHIPASLQQKQMLFLGQTTDKDYYKLSFIQNFALMTDIRKLQYAFLRLIMRQTVLRTTFVESDGEIFQQINSATEAYFQSAIHPVGNSVELSDAIEDFENTSFQVSNSPLILCKMFRTENDYTVIMLLHHAITDAWSTRLIDGEISRLYEAAQQGYFVDRSLVYSYAHYSVEQNSTEIRSQLRSLASEYAENLSSLLPDAISTTKFLRRLWSSNNERFAEKRIVMGEKFVSDLHFLLEEVRSSLFGILLSIFSLTVHHMIGDHSLSIISPAANRNYKTNEIVGNFLNNLIFVSVKKPDASLEDYLQTFSQQITQFTKYIRVPYSLLVGQLRKKGTIGKTSVLSEILFNCRYDIEDNNSVTIPSSKAGNPQMRSMGYMIEFHVDSTSSTLHCLLRVHSTIGSLISVDNFEKTFLQNAKELLSLFGRRRAEAKPIREVETLLSSKDVCQSDALFISDAVLEERSESVDMSLRKLWTKCLEHDEFTETDSFFLVGGDSLMCLRLQKLIKHKWHVELRLDEIIECDNFYRMVALIESRIWSSKAKLQSQVIVRINSTLNKRLLMVFFHPLIGGAILPYSTLMHSIRMQSQDISFIGVQHPNTFNLSVDSSKVPSSIEGLCSLYANHLSIIIRDYFEVIFTGASLGGILAYQTYRSLKKLHKHISRIILIDSRAQCSESTLISKSQHQQQMTKIIEEYLESEGVSDQNDDTVKMAMVENAWSLLTMLVRYKPEKDTSVNVHLLKASKESGDYGWSDLCVVNVVPIAGDHSTMMNRRNSDQLAGVILKIISEKNI